MKLAAKIVFVVVLGIAVALVIDGYVSLRRQRDLSEADMHHDIHVLGLAIRRLMLDTWDMGERERTWRAIEDVNEVEPAMDIRWVWLDVPQGDVRAPRTSRDRLEPAIRGQDVFFSERSEDGEGYFYSYFPVAIDNQRPGAIEIREPLSKLDGVR